MPDPFLQLLTDLKGQIISADPQALEILGLSANGRCHQAIGACVGKRSVCTTECVTTITEKVDHGVVEFRGAVWRLVCATLGQHRVITLIPLPRQVLKHKPLTPRECEVLTLAARGRTNPQIARSLEISISTVRTHIEHILTRLNVRSRTAAAAVSVAAGTIEL